MTPGRASMRAVAGVLVLALAAATDARAAPARQPAHPLDDTEVSAGGEVVPRGAAPPRPAVGFWKVRATLGLPPSDRALRVALLVPLSDGRQDVLGRRATAAGFRFREGTAAPNLEAEWTAERTAGATVIYEVAVRIAATSATVPRTPRAALRIPPEAANALEPSSAIQSAAPAVVRRARRAVGDATRLDEAVWSLFQVVAAFGAAADPRGAQDAASVLRAGRGTRLGRTRALVALLRAAGVPARVVGGLRLGDATERRATISWVEAWVGDGWVPLDPSAGHFAALPDDYLALYRGDLPLIVHTRGLALDYGFTVRRAGRREVEEGEGEEAETAARPAAGDAEAHAAHVREPVGSAVVVTDERVPPPVTEQILGEAREAGIDLVILTAPFESRYFRETYLERLIAQNLPLVREADLLLVATADDAGFSALMTLGARGISLPDSRIVVAGAMARPAAVMLGALLAHLVRPGEVAVVPRATALLPLWEMARANLIDGTPMREGGERAGVGPIVLGEDGERLPRWRRPVMRAWARLVRAQVPLGALTLILVLPVIAALVVVARVVVGVETFGMFGPVIVSLAFVTTGLWWGTVIFVVIVGLGVALRVALQRLRLQAVARLAILVTLVAAVMGGLTLVGATLGIGPLLHIGIFPMIIMSNVIENFGASQVEFGTRQALRTTAATFALAVACYLVVDRAGLQALVLAFPELLLATIAFDVLLGKWRGLRLVEYLRFLPMLRAPAEPGRAPEGGGPPP